MFGFFKKKPSTPCQSEGGAGEPLISYLLLQEKSFPFDAFLKQLAKTRIAGRKVSEPHRNGDIVTFELDDELVAIALMPAPYPASDLEGPIATSWMWPRQPPIDEVKRHQSHLLITMMRGNADPVRRRLILTAVTAFAARAKGVIAVYWPEATLVHFPPVFIEMAKEIDTPEAPPLYLWVDQRVFRNEDGTIGLFTTGLAPLGHMEIEIPSIDMDPGELREWLLNIVCYLLEKGPVLKDGETLGMTAEQKIRIRHCKSSFGHPGQILRLEP